MSVSGNGAPKYTIMPDGHIVGIDGFVCPLTFEEFSTRFPNHVWNFARQKARYRRKHDLFDIKMDCLSYLEGYDLIPQFRPGGEVTSLTWFTYINHLLLHWLIRTYQVRRQKPSLSHILAQAKRTMDL